MKTLTQLVKELQLKYRDTHIITYKKNNPHTWGIYYRTSYGDYLICSGPAQVVLQRKDATHKDPITKSTHRSEFEIVMMVDSFMKNKIEAIKERFEETWEDNYEDDSMHTDKVEEEKARVEKFLASPDIKYKSESIKNKLKNLVYEEKNLQG